MKLSLRSGLDRLRPYLARNPMHPTVDHIVDNRVFLLGLDELYRTAIKPHERGELLECARAVARTLNVAPANVPIEGYYTENAELTEYFKLVRALQAEGKSSIGRVERMREFRRLLEVLSSPIYGRAMDVGLLLPIGHDPLRQALADEWPRWSLNGLIDRAYQVSVETGDYSLVGLAVLSRDPVVVAGLRESVVLYSGRSRGADMRPPIPRFIWQVDDVLAQRAARFVAAFNTLFDADLPTPIPDNAEEFFSAAKPAAIIGRCVCIGTTDPPAIQYYHWAIFSRDGELSVEDFWHDQLWTTEHYRIESARRDLPPRLRDLL